MPNVMAALPNIGGDLCSTPQSLADAHYQSAVQQRCQDAKPVEISWGALNSPTQPLEGRNSPYCGSMWRRYCCLTSFFPIVDTCLNCEDSARRRCTMVPRWRFLRYFLRPVFPASPVEHNADLHAKFALRPHHVWKYGRPLRSGEEKRRR